MSAMTTIRISVLMACHNRQHQTLECLVSLQKQTILRASDASSKYDLALWLLDDASTDGTTNSVLKLWPDANILLGDGKCYWCGGMREAWKGAALLDPDYYLLINDDTTLTDNAVEELLFLVPTPEEPVIAVAAISDPRSGKTVFGGHKGHSPSPIQPKGYPEQCDTMNANCCLVPRAVYRKIGGLSNAYTHSMGDFDYGFKATRKGILILQSSRNLGFSTPNCETGSWRDRTLTTFQRLKLLWFSPTKGLPFFEWCIYCFKNYGWHSLIKCASPSIRILFGK